MREDYRLLTPENVELEFDVAGLGSRVAAALIDYCIISVCYLVLILGVAFISGLARAIAPASIESGRGSAAIFALFAVALLVGFLAWWGYFLLFELTWAGQSPGKRALGLRVVRRDGQPLDFTAALVRNILRWIDQVAMIGVFVMVFDTSSRRLGDMAAGTLVVRDPRGLRTKALEPIALPTVADTSVQALPNAARITMDHYTLIRDYFDRARVIKGPSSDALAATLARELARVLEIHPTDVGPPERFLATVARAFEERHRYSETLPSS